MAREQSTDNAAPLLAPAAEEVADRLAELLDRVARKDRAAFKALYSATSPRLFAIILRMIRQREIAEDTLQDVYLAVWNKAAEYQRERGAALAWMTMLTRSRTIDRLRVLSREQSRTDDDADADQISVAPPTSANPENIAVRRCVQALPEKQRTAILLSYYHGMTHSELSTHLDAPLGTVKSWVRRGLVELKACMNG